MSATHTANWSDPATCPFCGAGLADPGAGFVDHIADNPDCERVHEEWKENVAGDVTGGWSG